MKTRYLITICLLMILSIYCLPQVVNANNQEQHFEPLKAYPEQPPLGRLPQSVRPTMYWLDLTIDPDKGSFNGIVRINLDIDVETQHIWLHGKDIKAQSIQLLLSDGSTVNGQYVQVDNTGVVKLTFEQAIFPGSAQLQINYETHFNNNLEGLYRINEAGINYVFTHFQPISARLAFPGFDEPAFKVPFNYTIKTRVQNKVFGNSRVTSETAVGDGWKEVRFAQTQPLPTYLVAFAIGDFDVVEWQDIPTTDIRHKTIPLRGIATKGKGDQLNYALENTKGVLINLEQYFEIPFPYEKLDIVAVPEMAFTAMENAGLITYREQLLLLDNNAPLQQKQAYLSTHAHEIAHQWFGNLVTLEWWDDLWLNEAFATWLSYVSNSQTYPEYQFDQMLLSRSLGIMTADSLMNARTIRHDINNNDEVQSAFTGITYIKGGGLLSMLEAFIGKENFRSGIKNYLKKHAFKNANADDFITALGEQSSIKSLTQIKQSFSSFLNQPGIPLLNLKFSCKDTLKPSISITQSRYLPLGSKGSTTQTWDVPACIKYSVNGHQKTLCDIIKQEQQVLVLPEEHCPSFIMPNSNGSGYYRFSLSKDGWQSLLKHSAQLSAEDMMSITNNLEGAINAGKLKFNELIEITPTIIDNNSAAISLQPIYLLSFVYNNIAENKQQKAKLAKLYRSLYGQRLKELGLVNKDTDSINAIQLRTQLISFLSNEGEDKAIRKFLLDMAIAYTGYMGDNKVHPEKADSNVIKTAIKVAVEDLGKPYAQHLRNLLEKAKEGSLRNQILSGLASIKDPEYAAEVRDLILTPSIRDNEIGLLIFDQLSSSETRAPMWKWFKENFEHIKSRTPPSYHADLVIVGQSFCSAPEKEEFISFFRPLVKGNAAAEHKFQRQVEVIELCISQVEFHQKYVDKYLKLQ
ncbi:M1 family metallopeptidase [Kangiella koreensis]|uniref:Aminopeptidase n=1 Tax=Kangiella koreensis (strain DSM 16069 / JCM 12317 / KCTC 12182 / SW-125) TaxID=523791 RepID=C7R7S8_KANKD|nr:M1 family metallopeptidase [Kangiella koreensis]ACV27611.1 Peptidase M1 membrane alanine aminopeptidase [Kangiella koreensis DSM 16069]